MKITGQIIGCNKVDSLPSLIIYCENENILFNCGEGTQRFCLENKVRMSKIKHIFLNSLSIEYIGGLLGFLLTINDMGKEVITIYGPTGLQSYYNILQTFFQYRVKFKISIKEINTIYSIFECSNFIVHSYLCNENYISISYIIQPKIRPKFLPMKAKSLGIPAGPFWSQLSQGNDIEINGKIFCSSDVLDQPIDIPYSLILCESQYNTDFNNIMRTILSDLEGKKLVYIFHICEDMSAFHKFDDIFANKSTKQIALLKTNQLNNVNFYNQSLLVSTYFDFMPFSTSDIIESNLIVDLPSYIELCEPLSEFYILDRSLQGSITLPTIPHKPITTYRTDMITAVPNYNILIDELKRDINQYKQINLGNISESVLGKSRSRITVLGSGCAIPSKYRNVSCIYVQMYNPMSQIPDGVLLDCGEGSFGQFCRSFNNYQDYINNIKVIYISHSHADHFLGLFRFLVERTTTEKCTIICGDILYKYIDQCTYFDKRLLNKFIYINIFEAPKYSDYFVKMGLGIDICRVMHNEDSHAIKLYSHHENWSLIYTGDCSATRHIDEFSTFAQNVNILIHECTFSNESLAISKYHSCFQEIIELIKKTNPNICLVTHFSQRFPKYPVLESSLLEKLVQLNNCFPLFDFLSCNFSDLCYLPLSVKYFNQVFNLSNTSINDLDDDVIDDD